MKDAAVIRGYSLCQFVQEAFTTDESADDEGKEHAIPEAVVNMEEVHQSYDYILYGDEKPQGRYKIILGFNFPYRPLIYEGEDTPRKYIGLTINMDRNMKQQI